MGSPVAKALSSIGISEQNMSPGTRLFNDGPGPVSDATVMAGIEKEKAAKLRAAQKDAVTSSTFFDQATKNELLKTLEGGGDIGAQMAALQDPNTKEGGAYAARAAKLKQQQEAPGLRKQTLLSLAEQPIGNILTGTNSASVARLTKTVGR